MKKILILGANPETANLVRTAKDMNIYTIVTDNMPNSYAKRFADEAWDIDGLDIQAICDAIRTNNVDGVMVGTADPLIPSYRAICTEMGFPCYVPLKALDVFTNKRYLQKECEKYGLLSVPEYSLDDVKNDEFVSYPVVVKPADGRSAKGISVCYKKEEVIGALEKAKEYSICKDVLIQKYMECDDVILYYTFADGQYFLSAIADRYTSKEQHGYAPIVLGGIYPSKHLETYLSDVHDKMCALFRGLDIKDGIFMMQAFVENGEFYLYDPGFRLQGGAPHVLVRGINDFDHERMLINFALTGEFGLSEIIQKNDYSFKGKIGASQVILLKKGIVKKIFGMDEVRNIPNIIFATQRIFEGDEVYIEGSEQQVLVRFHMICDSMDELKSLVSRINCTIRVIDVDGNDMCLNGLEVF